MKHLYLIGETHNKRVENKKFKFIKRFNEPKLFLSEGLNSDSKNLLPLSFFEKVVERVGNSFLVFDLVQKTKNRYYENEKYFKDIINLLSFETGSKVKGLEGDYFTFSPSNIFTNLYMIKSSFKIKNDNSGLYEVIWHYLKVMDEEIDKKKCEKIYNKKEIYDEIEIRMLRDYKNIYNELSEKIFELVYALKDLDLMFKLSKEEMKGGVVAYSFQALNSILGEKNRKRYYFSVLNRRSVIFAYNIIKYFNQSKEDLIFASVGNSHLPLIYELLKENVEGKIHVIRFLEKRRTKFVDRYGRVSTQFIFLNKGG